MRFDPDEKRDSCPRNEIAAYVDGELALGEELILETHLAKCGVCEAEYRSQKRLLCALDAMRAKEADEIALPEDFTRIVAANAESDVAGIRTPKERSRALFVCAVLLLLGVLGVGTGSGAVGRAAEQFAGRVSAVSGFAMHLMYEVTVGLTVVLGSVCQNYLFSSILPLAILLAFFIFSSVALSGLILRLDRT